MERITGKILKVIYKNESNNYAIVIIKIDFKDPDMEKYKDILISNTLTITGYYERIPLENEEFSYLGEFVETKYGIQLKATNTKRINANSKEGVITYLSSAYFPGIGKVLASKIYEALGNNCLELIEEDIKNLDKVSGLSQAQKEMIYNNLKETSLQENNLVRIVNMGFTLLMAKRIINTIPEKNIKKVFSNPYYLIDKVEGIGFLRADSIALAMGFKEDDPLRIEACIKYLINQIVYETGNTYVPMEELKIKVINYINISNELFDEAINKLVNNNKIFIDESNNVFDLLIHNSEVNLANYITQLIKRDLIETSKNAKIENAFFEAQNYLNISYSPMQARAIIEALKENIIIITGGPGTGKTTIVKGIIRAFSNLHKDISIDEVVLLAPTGRASKRLVEVTNHPSQTIHKFLGYDGKHYNYNENNKVDCKLVIVDEMSMVDVSLAYHLFSALNEDCKVVLVGDKDQIPSVGPGEVLSDLIRSKEIKTIHLDKIHRQAEDSTIISLAHSVNNGVVPESILEVKHDRSFIRCQEEYIASSVVEIVRNAINKGMNLFSDIQILIPKYRGPIGIDKMNEILQEEFNPLEEFGQEFVSSKERLRIGDKVIQLVNRNEEQIMNGDIGVVSNFLYQNNRINGVSVAFESKVVDYTKEDIDDLKLAYAISIHKSQGSEFKTVIIPLSKRYHPMLKRKLYYTAITRAKSFLILVGDIEALQIASKSLGENRKTKLYDYIKINMQKSELSPYDFLDVEAYEFNNFDFDE